MDTAPGCADPSLVQLKTDLATIFGYLDGHSAAATHTRYLMTGYVIPISAPQETCTAERMLPL